MRHDAIPSNPADRVDFAGKRSTGDHEHFEHHPLTATQVAQVSGEVASMYPIYADGGLPRVQRTSRIRELRLEIRDLSFTTGPAKADGSPTTRCAISVRRTKNRKEGRWESSTPKSKRSRRTVPLPTWLAERMRDYLAKEHPRSSEPTAPLWPSRKNGGGFRPAGERYAVPLDWTQPIAMGAFYDTIFRPALVVVGLPASAPATTDLSATRGVRLHDLRHTFATMHLMAGTHFMQVSKWLGHSTFTLTLDTYGDWIPEEDGGAGNDLPEPTLVATAPIAGRSNVLPLFGMKSG